FSPADEGTDDAADSDADPVTGMTMCTMLEVSEIDSTWDAGMYEPAQEGCTYSKGYWKNHAGFGPQEDVVTVLLPVWLGNEDGDKSIPVTDSVIAVDVLVQRSYGSPSNGITKLYAQLLAAKLNIANGADDGDVADAVEDADDFLADYDWNDWDILSNDDRQMVLEWKDTLDMYNNGFIGPGYCDEYDDYSNTGSAK
ncbi:MAG: hypothetical protein JSU69_04935, partial [Candidatus Zixiibacteriota bacterium]